MVKFYKDGDRMGIKTDCDNPYSLMFESAVALSEMIGSNLFNDDWQFQLEGWLPQLYEICLNFEKPLATVKRSIIYEIGNTQDKDIVKVGE